MGSRIVFAALVLGALIACKKSSSTESSPTPAIPVATADAGSTATEPAADDWTSFKSEAGKFEVKVPESMKSESSPSDTAAGEIETHMFTAKDGMVVYQVGYSDFPKAIIKAAKPQKLLKGGEDGAMKAINATATSSKEVTVQKYPGREFATVAEAEGVKIDYTGRAILVKNRLYQLQVLGPSGSVDETEKRKFIDSFKITE